MSASLVSVIRAHVDELHPTVRGVVVNTRDVEAVSDALAECPRRPMVMALPREHREWVPMGCYRLKVDE